MISLHIILPQALQFGFLDFSNFDVEEYEHYEVIVKHYYNEFFSIQRIYYSELKMVI